MEDVLAVSTRPHHPERVLVCLDETSKETLVVRTLPDDQQCTIDNNPQAVRRLIKAEIKRNRNKQLGQMLVICEATGGYERHVLDGPSRWVFPSAGHMARACDTLAIMPSTRAC
jgi:hypothetical protein